MSDKTSRYAERVVIYAMMALAAITWIAIGGAVFVGIVQGSGAG